ncbi:MAG: transketolase, partial [Pseudomonadota bacterium]|nr:transketolase [Pseudomonadota bacterium]
GMALAERMMQARYGDDLVDHYTYVIAGDGCLMEGISHEAIDFAGHLGLGRLIVLWDDNRITIDGATDLSTSTDQGARFAAAGWHVLSVDGHDHDAVGAAIETARQDPRPTLIACRTDIGHGAPNKQGTSSVHGAPLGADEIAAARAALNWPHAPFEIPAEVYQAWHDVAERGHQARTAWDQRLKSSAKRAQFDAAHAPVDPVTLRTAVADYVTTLCAQRPKVATRKASEMALNVLTEIVPDMIGGSADLTGSNNTRAGGMTPVSATDYGANYIHYGIREHGMGAAMNGMALHGGLRPYGGTFLVFSDYCRPAMRLSALMGVPVPYVMTHDSIGLGEDGPTHQPVEHLASLRAMPNMLVMRPCDAVETAEAWEVAMTQPARPSTLALSRQNLPVLRDAGAPKDNMTARGAYVLREAEGPRDITLIATGSEVEIAIDAAEDLAVEGIQA